MSDEERRQNKEMRKKRKEEAAKAAEDSVLHRQQQKKPNTLRCISLAVPKLVPSLRQRKRQEQPTTAVSSEENERANESPVLVIVDFFGTDMVFAHVCKKERIRRRCAGSYHGGHRGPPTSITPRRPEMKLGKKPDISLGGERARWESSAACDWVLQIPDGCIGSQHQTSNRA